MTGAESTRRGPPPMFNPSIPPAEKILAIPSGDHSHLEKMAGSLRTLRMVRLARMVWILNGW